ncbi:glycoprotein-N-acetylgalactosamine 3-beta-galactosyltransferase 1 isoform X3 [Aethina tumida]|uniref:glycoprotein-N-acetylgalactosamine 3-beta-galactosyltransferase 1 isoform X3 n=1 Tax=Aethina tumida TaxID=116153 RepID=UPI0021486058|nr:glycoprotein-N-acetylgalactosamine 3-beta-galactosyltransferase 1 isoform X3 [Aethina tumida]
MFKTTRTRLRKTLLIVYRRYQDKLLLKVLSSRPFWYLALGLLIGSCVFYYQYRPGIPERVSNVIHTPQILPRLHNLEKLQSKCYNSSVADSLRKQIRIVCAVVLKSVKEEVINSTWAKRCDKVAFFNNFVPVVGLKTPEGRENLWGKSREALKYLYDNYLTEYDWFMKADDDTYVIMENLRYLLRDKDPTDAIYFGCKYKSFVKQGYMSGGAGYVMSREALKRFVEVGLEMKPVHCKKNEVLGNEDVEVGRCLEASGVKAGDSRDKQGRIRFFGLYMEEIMSMSAGSGWYSQYQFYYRQQGLESLSDYPVALHYVTPVQMYFLEYMLYHARAYGLYPVDDA